jgi:hypothetical protein
MHKLAGVLALLLGRIAIRLAAYAQADTRRSAHRTTATIAGWNPVAGDMLAAAGVGHRAAARLFAEALRPERLQ